MTMMMNDDDDDDDDDDSDGDGGDGVWHRCHHNRLFDCTRLACVYDACLYVKWRIYDVAH